MKYVYLVVDIESPDLIQVFSSNKKAMEYIEFMAIEDPGVEHELRKEEVR